MKVRCGSANRQAQAGVVTGVLTDQVHTARSSPHALGRSAVGVDEQLGSLRDAFLMGQRLNEFTAVIEFSFYQSAMSMEPSS